MAAGDTTACSTPTQKRSGAVHRDLLTEQNTRLASIETMLGEILAELRKPKS